MRILCPMCGFGREMDEAKIPPRAQMATCPSCQHKFRFRVVDNLEPAGPAAPGQPAPPASPLRPGPGQDLSASTVDPLAAQRAAAAEAWKRIQGVKPEAPMPEGPRPEAASALREESPQPVEPPRPGTQSEAQSPGWSAPGAGQAAASPVPFEDLPRFGFFPGLSGTIRQVLTGPKAFFQAMPVTGGMAKPLIFYLLLSEFMVFCHFAWGLLGIGGLAQFLDSREMMDMGMSMAGAAPVLFFVVAPLVLVLNILLMTGVVHLLLRLLRSGSAGAEATFRVLCYATAPMLLSVIPVLGPQIGEFWSLGLAIIGLKAVHRSNLSAAAFAVIVPMLLLLAAVIGFMQGMLKAG